MEKTYWLSYDLGIGGNYEKLYGWLDDHKAKPCGDSVAYFQYSYNQGENPDEVLKKDLLGALDLKAGNKLYIIRKMMIQVKLWGHLFTVNGMLRLGKVTEAIPKKKLTNEKRYR